MKSVYQVNLQHRHYANETEKPWVVARNIDEAKKKAISFLRKQKAKIRSWEIESISKMGTVEVE